MGVLARVDRALDEITSRPPSNVCVLRGLEIGQAAPLLEFAAPDGGEPVQLGRSVMVSTSEGCAWYKSLVAAPIIHPFDPGQWGRVLVWDAKDQSPIPPLPGWVVIGATSATALESRFQVQGTPYGVVIDGDGRVAAVGIPNKAVDIRCLEDAAERHIILSRPARVDHGAGTQLAVPVR
ncbi:hypothetical protein [Rugosimonospora africana]|uniref:hypothetical protein n=1 Tax=Rugosimonospora africana TaxID=556532 RepID=UPI001941E4CE|nr:hypothetical protein [Rugosimonospora africana]